MAVSVCVILVQGYGIFSNFQTRLTSIAPFITLVPYCNCGLPLCIVGKVELFVELTIEMKYCIQCWLLLLEKGRRASRLRVSSNKKYCCIAHNGVGVVSLLYTYVRSKSNDARSFKKPMRRPRLSGPVTVQSRIAVGLPQIANTE